MHLLPLLSFLLFVLCLASGSTTSSKPNILFIIVESTDGRAYFVGNEDKAPMPMPHLRKLIRKGVTFNNTYVTAPICCPSRASIWSGRHVHRLRHKNPTSNQDVDGAWNNFEGLDNSTKTFADLIEEGGYNVKITGKTDYSAGEHSLSARVTSWTNKAKFPFTLKNHSYGFAEERGPVITRKTGNQTRSNDWKAVEELSDWIKEQGKKEKKEPWLGYFGARIMHPPYISSHHWLKKVNESLIEIPEWIDISKMHPEDFQSSMRKNMTSDLCCSDEFKFQARKYYYAMITEFDAMVGELVETVKHAGFEDDTWIVVMADHGDMQMEHRQFFKMVFYDASSRVPLIIHGPGVKHKGTVVNDVTSSLDVFPTLLDFAGVDKPSGLDGTSLSPLITTGNNDLPGFAVSQFHGEDIHLSWFMIRTDEWKYVTYGTGKEVPARLFNMNDDPDEKNDLIASNPEMAETLDAKLRSIIDYPEIATKVESYNKESFSIWRATLSDEEYNKTMTTKIRWQKSWAYDSEGCFRAITEWLKTPNGTQVAWPNPFAMR